VLSKKWSEIFNNDSTLTSAPLDRLLHHAERKTRTSLNQAFRLPYYHLAIRFFVLSAAALSHIFILAISLHFHTAADTWSISNA